MSMVGRTLIADPLARLLQRRPGPRLPQQLSFEELPARTETVTIPTRHGDIGAVVYWPEAGDDIVYKTRFSGFFETDLDARLKKLGVTHLIITGCTTSICVDSTVRDAMFRDYLCVLLADCMSEPIEVNSGRSTQDATLVAIEMALGWVSDSTRFLKALRP